MTKNRAGFATENSYVNIGLFLDYDECHPAKIVHVPDCGINGRCVNLNMTYVCACNEGFERNGNECISK